MHLVRDMQERTTAAKTQEVSAIGLRRNYQCRRGTLVYVRHPAQAHHVDGFGRHVRERPREPGLDYRLGSADRR